jgi:hypothetical protein
MNERENGQLPAAKQAARNKIPSERWEQIKTAHASGIGLREIARNMGIPEGTVLSRAKREGWSGEIQSAKALAKREDSPPALSPLEAVVMSIQQRGERHVDRMAGIVEKTLPHVESMEPGAILDRAKDVDRLDRIARRTYALDKGEQASGAVNITLVKMDLR